jgi:cysteine synthase A
MQLSSGIDPYLEVIRQALGETPELPFPGEVTAGGRWFGSPVEGTLSAIDLSELTSLPGYVSAQSYKEPGRAVAKLSKSNFDWLGQVIFTGKDREEVGARAEAALDRIRLTIDVQVAK